MKKSDIRFTRREVREHTGWGNTQLKVHLHRLEEMEYLLVHRGGRGQAFVYELAWDGEGEDGGAFLMGLINPDDLRSGREGPAHEYDNDRSGAEDKQSASSRGQVGVWPEQSNGETDDTTTACDERPENEEKRVTGAVLSPSHRNDHPALVASAKS